MSDRAVESLYEKCNDETVLACVLSEAAEAWAQKTSLKGSKACIAAMMLLGYTPNQISNAYAKEKKEYDEDYGL